MKVVAFDPYCVNIAKIFISVRQITSAVVEQLLSRSSESFCFVLKKNKGHL